MKQMRLSSTGFELATKRTRKREFLDEMNLVVPWSELVGLIEPHSSTSRTGRPTFAIASMLHIYFIQQWFGLFDPAMEEVLHDIPLYREFAQLDVGATRLPDESTVLRFRHLLEERNLSAQLLTTINANLISHGLLLKVGTVVDASIRAKVEYSFWVIKCQLGYREVRYKGLAKNTAQMIALFALCNLWMVRKRILQGTTG